MAAARLDSRECRLLADFFTLFGSATRLQLFCALQDGRKTVSELAELAGASIQNVSQHLRQMREKGAVTAERAGQCIYYDVPDRRLLEGACLIRSALADAVRRRAEAVAAGPEAAETPPRRRRKES